MEKRIEWIDELKGFLIFLVVVGHCIQYNVLQGMDIWQNPLFLLIYSFHMPLFAIISGYLFHSFSKRYTFLNGIKRKTLTILIPCLAWALCMYFFELVTYRRNFNLAVFVKSFPLYALNHNWFLWAIFYCSIVAFLCLFIDRKLFISTFLIILVCFCIPDYLNTINFKMMYIPFIVGYQLNEYRILEKLDSLKNARKNVFFILCLVVFVLNIVFFHKYESVWSFFSLRDITVFISALIRLISNLMCSICVLFVFYLCSQKHSSESTERFKLLSILGKNSLGVYMIQSFFFMPFVSNHFFICDMDNIYVRMIYGFVLSVLFTIICCGIIYLFKKSLYLKKIFLGDYK